jgi:hypothetical protein
LSEKLAQNADSFAFPEEGKGGKRAKQNKKSILWVIKKSVNVTDFLDI